MARPVPRNCRAVSRCKPALSPFSLLSQVQTCPFRSHYYLRCNLAFPRSHYYLRCKPALSPFSLLSQVQTCPFPVLTTISGANLPFPRSHYYLRCKPALSPFSLLSQVQTCPFRVLTTISDKILKESTPRGTPSQNREHLRGSRRRRGHGKGTGLISIPTALSKFAPWVRGVKAALAVTRVSPVRSVLGQETSWNPSYFLYPFSLTVRPIQLAECTLNTQVSGSPIVARDRYIYTARWPPLGATRCVWVYKSALPVETPIGVPSFTDARSGGASLCRLTAETLGTHGEGGKKRERLPPGKS
uniref:Uncharacterized protein n=1 Tax=Branchiostoma floridae TaxID=7739 RepID=C3XZY5_BRAFL|eukprot:XP_002610341.1 hypothetical protein BRAFLDRAFT_72466 [Branchiostoma floridae]